MKKYKQAEVAEKHQVQAIRVSKWTEKEVAERGWEKHGEGQGCYYTRLDGKDMEIGSKDWYEEKKKWDALNAKQKNEKTQEAIFKIWDTHACEALVDAFAPLKDMLIESRFDEENIEKWNTTISTCVVDFQKNLENIYYVADI